VNVRTLGIDLAKNVFRVHGVDATGRTLVERQLRRRQLLPFMAQLQPCLVGIESCGGAHEHSAFVGLDVHKESIAIAVAETGRTGGFGFWAALAYRDSSAKVGWRSCVRRAFPFGLESP
jgi:hypothetical protein